MLTLALLALTAQSFDVATIKPAATDVPGRYMRMRGAHEFYAKNFTLKQLIGAAWDLNQKQISGGSPWTESETFDITAATPGASQPNRAEQMKMLRGLLVERFTLTFHRTPKTFPIY